MVGEMADELLLNGQRVVPAALQQAGFTFEYPELDLALRDIL
jgi:NAD dependent epimerase/dehydratase family enzyme